MKTSEIRFKVELDDENIPEKILWHATDGASQGLEEAKAMSVSVWDHQYRETLRIDLWTKDMPVDDMKKYYIDTLGGLANSLRTSIGDEFMAGETEKLIDKLVRYLQENQGK